MTLNKHTTADMIYVGNKICFIFAAAIILNWLMRPLKVVLYCFHFSFFSWSCTIYSISLEMCVYMRHRRRRRFWWIECDLTAHTFSSFIHANDVLLYEFLYFFIRLLSYLCLPYIHHSLLIIIHLWHINLLCHQRSKFDE